MFKESKFYESLSSQILPKLISLGHMQQSFREKAYDVTYKQDEWDPVTEADKIADAELRPFLTGLIKDSQILSEEDSSRPDNFNGYVWVVDPLDGTKDYVAGLDSYSVMIGLLRDTKPVFGMVYAPARNVVFAGAEGIGAYALDLKTNQSTRLHVSECQTIAASRFITRSPLGGIRPIETPLNAMAVSERVPEGSMGLKICLIASGKADLYICTTDRVSLWDVCAAEIILTEAGGHISDFEGNAIAYDYNENVLPKMFLAASTEKLLKESITFIQDQQLLSLIR